MEIRLIRESEYITVNDFFNNTCGINAPGCKTARDFHRFRWEFLEGPGRKAIYAGAWEVELGKEPVLAGIQCVIIHQMISADGHTILAAKGEDTLIDIRAIGNYKNTDILKELFTLLTDECMKLGVKYLWGFNNIPATYRRLGFDNAFKSFYAVLVLNPVATYKQITAKPGSRALQNLKAAGKSTLVLVKEIAHGEILSSLTNLQFANGKNTDSVDIIKFFSQGKLPVIVGTNGVVGEGVDTKPCEYVIIAGLGKSKNAFMQQVGRGIRKYPGKDSCKIIIFKDLSHKWTNAHFKEQVKILRDEYGVEPIEIKPSS